MEVNSEIAIRQEPLSIGQLAALFTKVVTVDLGIDRIEDPTTKTCKTCEETKDLGCFLRRVDRGKVSYRPECKDCMAEKRKSKKPQQTTEPHNTPKEVDVLAEAAERALLQLERAEQLQRDFEFVQSCFERCDAFSAEKAAERPPEKLGPHRTFTLKQAFAGLLDSLRSPQQ